MSNREFSEDALIRSLNARIDHLNARNDNKQKSIDFLLPLASKMLILYLGMAEYPAMRDQWDSLTVTTKLLEPEVDDIFKYLTRDQDIGMMQNYLEDNELYINEIVKHQIKASDESISDQ